MDTFREMSGIAYYVARNDIHQQPASVVEAKMPIRARPTPSEPLKNSQDSKPSMDRTKAFLPLMEVIVDVNVIGSNSRTVLTQIFSNPTDEVISESRYIFPLYDGSTVVNFRYWVGAGPMIEGVVKPKKEARTIFENALAEKKIASLLIEETPEIFEISLGNIPPANFVRVEILYLNELKLDVGGEGLLVTVPTSIAPRYGKAPVQEMFMRRQTELSGKGLRIQVDIAAPDPLHVPESRTHPIKYIPASVDDFAELADTTSMASRIDSSKGQVSTTHPFPVLDRDFVLLVKTKDRSISEPRALMEHCETSCDTAALQVSVNPLQLFADAERTCLNETEVIFVIDRSGSMNEKIGMLKKALEIFLEKISAKHACLFNICSFGSHTRLLWPQSTPCTTSSLKHALEFLSTSCRSNMGGTELKSALEVALDTRSNSKDVKTQFIIMTDGEVWDYNGVLSFIKSTKCKYHDKVRYFVLGIGDEVSHQLVEGIAREGGGFANVIPVGPYGDWKSGIMRILDGAMVSDNWELSLRLGGAPRAGTDVEDVPQHGQAPFRILSLHAFTTSRVYFLFQGKPAFKHVIVEGKSTTGLPIAKTIPIEPLKVTTPIIHQLAAKAIMKDLEAVAGEDSENCSENLATDNKRAHDQAVELGLTWNIIGKHTSFVGVDSATQEETTTRTYKNEYLDLDDLQELHRHDLFVSPALLHNPREQCSSRYAGENLRSIDFSCDSDDGAGLAFNLNDSRALKEHAPFLDKSPGSSFVRPLRTRSQSESTRTAARMSPAGMSFPGMTSRARVDDDDTDDDDKEEKVQQIQKCRKRRQYARHLQLSSNPFLSTRQSSSVDSRNNDDDVDGEDGEDDGNKQLKKSCYARDRRAIRGECSFIAGCPSSAPCPNILELEIRLTDAHQHDIWIQLGPPPSTRREEYCLTFFLLEAQHQDGWFQLNVGSRAQCKKYFDNFFKQDCKMKLSDHLKGVLRRSLEQHLQGHPERHGNIMISLEAIQQLRSLKFDIPGRKTILSDLSNFQPNCSPDYVSSILADLEAKCCEWEVLEDKAMNTVLAVVFLKQIKIHPASPFLHERLGKADSWLSQNLQDENLKTTLLAEASAHFDLTSVLTSAPR